MRLILVRHGVTDKNLDPTLKGFNVPLNKAGRQQAEQVASRLANEKVDLLYSSDLLRAQQTAEAIAARLPKVKIAYTAELRERSSGQLAHLSWSEKEAIQKSSGQSARDWRPAGGESLRDLKERANRWWSKLRIENAGKMVLVVGHGLFMYALLECAVEDGADVERDDYFLKNCSLTVLDVHPEGRAKVVHLNDVRHLDEPNSNQTQIAEQ